MFSISQYFYGSSIEEKNNVYKDIITEILIKRRNKLFTIYGILNTYSINSKKKIDDIMNNKSEIINAINNIKNDTNIIYYYYCKGEKIYYLFEYSITPTIRNTKENIDITINEQIDGEFAIKINVDIIKNILEEPKKYINFSVKNLKMNNSNILKQLIISNEEKMFLDLIEKHDIYITDTESGCGIKYKDLLNIAISSNNSVIVNCINKTYYEKKYENPNKIKELEMEEKEKNEKIHQKYQKYYKYALVGSQISGFISVPLLFYISSYISYCQ
jgi:hypothetical protein